MVRERTLVYHAARFSLAFVRKLACCRRSDSRGASTLGKQGRGGGGGKRERKNYYITILALFTSPSGDSGSFLTVNTVIFVCRDNEPVLDRIRQRLSPLKKHFHIISTKILVRSKEFIKVAP